MRFFTTAGPIKPVYRSALETLIQGFPRISICFDVVGSEFP